MAYVMSPGDGLLEERIKLVKELREAGIKVKAFSFFFDYLSKLRAVILFLIFFALVD